MKKPEKKAMDEILLEVKGLRKFFPIRRGLFSRVVGNVKAVDGVSLSIKQGKTLGMVGESGCGKTTAGRSIIRLIEPSAGEVNFRGRNILNMGGQNLRDIRKQMQIVFQDPYSSLNPRITVGGMLSEILRFHNIVPKSQIKDKIADLLENVGLAPDYAGRYPHEFSGGQRQRIGIARALSVQPEFMVLDEPVSALDVSIQAQILNLLMDLQKRMNLTYLFIAHDLSVVEHISDEIAVMYLGRVVEVGPSQKIIYESLHPYTQALLKAVPSVDPDIKPEDDLLTGDVPSPANPPTGCHFHPRCPVAKPECKTWEFKMIQHSTDRKVACILYGA